MFKLYNFKTDFVNNLNVSFKFTYLYNHFFQTLFTRKILTIKFNVREMFTKFTLCTFAMRSKTIKYFGCFLQGNLKLPYGYGENTPRGISIMSE